MRPSSKIHVNVTASLLTRDLATSRIEDVPVIAVCLCAICDPMRNALRKHGCILDARWHHHHHHHHHHWSQGRRVMRTLSITVQVS